MPRPEIYRGLYGSFRSRVSISYFPLISHHFLSLLVILICVQSGFNAIEVPNSNIRTLLKAQSTDIIKDGQYRNSISFEKSSTYDNENKVNVTYFGRTLSISHNQDNNVTMENGRYQDRGKSTEIVHSFCGGYTNKFQNNSTIFIYFKPFFRLLSTDCNGKTVDCPNGY